MYIDKDANLVAEEYQVDAVEGDGRRKQIWKLKFWSRHVFVVLSFQFEFFECVCDQPVRLGG